NVIKWLLENDWRAMMSNKCPSFRWSDIAVYEDTVTVDQGSRCGLLPSWTLLDGPRGDFPRLLGSRPSP
ncbi:hypothetical protein L195_g013970, partial [Trifolium pratense]